MTSELTNTKAGISTRAARGEATVAARPSLVLYAVLGTLALGLASAPPAQAQQQEMSPAVAARPSARLVEPVNLAPLRAVFAKGWRMVEGGEIAVNGPTEITIEAARDESGRFNSFKINYPESLGERMQALTPELASALAASRAFDLLPVSAREALLMLRLDADTLSLQAFWDSDTPENAARSAQGYGLMLAAARARRRGTPEEAVYNNMTATASGKRLALRLEMSRAMAGNLLLRQVTPN